jgi:hypothetical protein
MFAVPERQFVTVKFGDRMTRKSRYYVLGWALIGAPAIVYFAGKLEHIAAHPPESLLILISGLLLPGLALGTGTIVVGSLFRGKLGLVVASVYAVVLYSLTLIWDNQPLYMSHATLVSP